MQIQRDEYVRFREWVRVLQIERNEYVRLGDWLLVRARQIEWNE